MPATVNHVLTATTPDNTSYEIKPSNWNSQHAITLNLSGTDIIGAFSNANSVSFGTNGGGFVTASVNITAAPAPVNVTAGTTSGNLQTIAFSNSNNFTFGLNVSTITASYSQTNQTVASGNIAGTGFSSTTTGGTAIVGTHNTAGLSLGVPAYLTTQTVQTQASGNIGATGFATTTTNGVVIVGTNNTTGFTLAVPPYITTYVGQTTQTQPAGNIAGIGTTTTTQAGTTLGATLSTNGLSLAFPPWITTAAGGGNAASVGVSTGGNTLGNTGIYSGQVVFAGGNNITLSVSSGAAGAQTITISGPNAGGAQTGISSIVVSNTTYTNGLVSFVNANGASFGSSGASGISVSYTVPTQTNQTVGLYMVSQSTGASSSSTIDARSFSVAGYGVISVGLSAGTLQISGPASTGFSAFSAGMSTGGNTLGTTGLASNQLVLAGGANITLSGSTNAGSMTISIAGGAGGAGAAISAAGSSQNAGTIVFSNSNNISFGMNGSTITASASAQSNQTIGLYAVGNTTQNSSTTLDARTLSFDYLGAMTGGYSNGSIQISAPATSSISGTGLVSVSVNGSTISIGAQLVQLSFFQPLGPVQNTSITQNGLGSVQVYPAIEAFPFTATRADIMASVSAAVLAVSTQAQTLSMYIGLYSLNGSTLSLASSGSQSYAWTNSSNNSNASITGLRRFSAPINVNYTGGFNLFVGVMTNTTFVNTNGISLSNVVVPLGPGPQLQGLIGQTQVNSMQFVPGQGFFSVTSAAMPVSMGLSGISGAGSGGNAIDYYAPVQFVNMTA